MLIRETAPDDLAAILAVQMRAFGQDEEANLTAALMKDPSAAPHLSLLAVADSEPAGHILFTSVRVEGTSASPGASILAPLAVVPQMQGGGIGSALVRQGLERLKRAGMNHVFVLGDPDFYTRFGFAPAYRAGFTPPYPIAEQYADAWMVRSLGDGEPGLHGGRVLCAAALSRPELWRA